MQRNLRKVDERMLLEQWKIDGRAEGKAEGRIEGRAEGITEGRMESQVEIAKNALAKGSTPEFVHEITGLDIDTIQRLYNESLAQG